MGKRYLLSVMLLVIALMMGREVQAQYTGGIGSGYAMASTDCFVPIPVATYDEPFCEGGDLQLYASGIPAVTYSWSGPGGFTSTEQNPLVIAATSGIYTVVALLDGCGTSQPFELNVVATVGPTPTINILAIPGNNICSADEVTFVASITNGGAEPAYQWYVNGVLQTGQSGQSFVSSILADGDEVQAYLYSSATCAIPYPALSNIITINVGDVVVEVTAEVSPGSTVCAGTPLLFTAVSQTAGATPQYQWFKNGTEISGATSVSYATSVYTTGDQFSVRLTSSLTSCISGPSTVMSAPLTITALPLPTAFAMTGGGSYCVEGATGVEIGLAGSESGIDYQMFDGTNLVGNVISGTGSPISFGIISTVGTYQVHAVNTSTLCEATMTGSAAVSISTLPAVFNITGGGSYCQGGAGLAVGLDDSQAGISYELIKDGTPTGITVNGTGNAISFGLQTAAGIYTAEAYSGGLSCEVNMNGNTSISIDPLPALFVISTGGSYCAGGAGIEITLSGSETGVDYQLYLGSNPVGSAITGTGSALSFGLHTTQGTYTVVGINETTFCEATMTGSALIEILPLPQSFSVTTNGNSVICAGTTGPLVGLNGSQVGVSYQLLLDGEISGSALSGTGSALSFGVQSQAGTYTVLAQNTTTLCEATMDGFALVTVLPTPEAYTVSGGGEYCENGSGVTIVLDNSQLQVSYQLYLNGTATGTSLTGTGAALNFENVTAAGTYTIVAIDAGSGCTSDMLGSAQVIVNPLPIADAGENQNIPYNTSAQLNAASGGAGSYSYSWTPAELFLDPNVQNPSTINLTETTTFSLLVTHLSTLCENTDDVTITVLDPIPTYDLVISISGQGTTVPAEGTHTYDENTEVTLTATPEDGWIFEKWIVNGSDITENPYLLTMNENKNVEAVFVEESINYTLSVFHSGDGWGTTTPEPGDHVYPAGTEITLTAEPGFENGFLKWNINGVDYPTNQEVVIITMDEDIIAIAEFYYVSVPGFTENSILLYPNPVSNKLFVEMKFRQAEGTIQVIGIQGQLVKSIKVNVVDDVHSIDVKDLPKGVYYLRISDGNLQHTRSFIKN